jgi:competence protein ComEA
MKILRVLLMFALSVFSIVTFAQAVDINTATAEQLDKGVKGIGPAKAAEIVKYREASGPYKSVDDLAKVPGIKEKMLQKLLADNPGVLTVGGAPAVPAATTKPAVPAAPAKPAVPAAPAKPAVPTAPAVPAQPKQ